MLRAAGCLTQLDPQARHLLSLRAGIHGRPLSAAATARALHMTQRRERLIEQLSLLRLETVATGGCAASTSPGATSTGATPAAGATSGGATSGSAADALVLSNAPSWAHMSSTFVSQSPATGAGTGSGPAASGTGGSASPPGHSGHGPDVVITPAANRSIVPAAASSSMPPSVMIPAFVALLLGLSLVALPGVRRRLLPAAGSAAAARAGRVTPSDDVPIPAAASSPAAPAGRTAAMTATAATAAVAASSPKPSPAATSTPEPTPAAAPTPTPPRPQPPSAPMQGATASPSSSASVASSPPSLGQIASPGRSTSPSWLRKHAGQAAVMTTVIAGGLARLASRGRGGSARRR